MKPPCQHCGKPVKQRKGSITRALRERLPIYCDRICAGLARRKYKTTEQKKEEKRQYDAQRQITKAAEIKAQKAERHRRIYDPAIAAVERKKRMPRHVEYCRRPEYRAYKSDYDRNRYASAYGDFAEAYKTILLLKAEIVERDMDYEIRLDAGTLNKSLKRKREYVKATS